MEIEKPKEETYFYECTEKNDRLYYHIPENKLEDLVRKGKAHKNILRDFPYGLDIKVTKDAFDEIQTKYKLILKTNPEETLNAFLSLRLKNKNLFQGSNYIEKKFLEDLAIKVKKEIDKKEDLKFEIPKKLESLKDRAKVLKAQVAMRNKKNLFLKNYKIVEFKKEKPITQQSFSRIKMTKGKDPFVLFNAIHTHEKKEK